MYGDALLLVALGMRRDTNGRMTTTGKRHDELVDFLLNNVPEVDVNQTNNEGYSPLMIASMKGDVKSARRLIELWAQPNLETNSGKTALMLAVQNCNPELTGRSQEESTEILRVLLGAPDIEVDTRDKFGRP